MAPVRSSTEAGPEARLLSSFDQHLFNEGSHIHLYEKMGAHPGMLEGRPGTSFAVWAPDAESVSVVGDFNGWNPWADRLNPYGSSGIWGGFLENVGKGALYKYHIRSRYHAYRVDKADPFALYAERPPRTASIVWDLDYEWRDADWMQHRGSRNSLESPWSIYEVHIGSWMRVPEDGNRPLTYREMAHKLADYVSEMGFTHVEFLPVTEHPFHGSWGYQVTGYFAPTSRYGTPQDFMYLVDYLHQRGIGVILDWVPSHFPTDQHGLSYFDGTHLFEHADPRKGYHPDWNTLIFNYGRNEVRSFLLSNAIFWLDKYHIDGLRMDAIASMLYLDYSRKAGEWIPNKYGGRENLEAVGFLRRVNEEVYKNFPDVQTIAEESTAWPAVSRPLYVGGLGFGMKWDMGWMHDTLQYMSRDPVHRKFHHSKLTFRGLYMFTENFVLPLSHDEVVHGKGSLLNKMPGDVWQKMANLRLLFGDMFTQPGKKLLFMGGEVGQWTEWNHDASVEWHLLQYEAHAGIQRWVRDLNWLYRNEPALHQHEFEPRCFRWVDADDSDASVLSYMRFPDSGEPLLIVCNFTPVPRPHYRVGVPGAGYWRELLNSDAGIYGGSNLGNGGGVASIPQACHGFADSIQLMLPPLAMVVLKR